LFLSDFRFPVSALAVNYLALILHAHLPFVRHPEHEHFLEEDASTNCTTDLLPGRWTKNFSPIANGATIFSRTSIGAITSEPLVIPSEVEESLTIVWL